jgi:hypothetical protein
MAETQWDYIPSNGRHWVERHAMQRCNPPQNSGGWLLGCGA